MGICYFVVEVSREPQNQIMKLTIFLSPALEGWDALTVFNYGFPPEKNFQNFRGDFLVPDEI